MLKISKEILIITILTTLILLFYVGLQIYTTAQRSTINKITEKQIVVLDPNLKTEIVEKLKENLSFSEDELNSITASKSTSLVTPTPTTKIKP